MATPSRVKEDEETVKLNHRSEKNGATVCACVMNALGRPVDLLRVVAIPLWGNRFRVNVQTGENAASVRIAHSFFVAADERGQIVESIPPITRMY